MGHETENTSYHDIITNRVQDVVFYVDNDFNALHPNKAATVFFVRLGVDNKNRFYLPDYLYPSTRKEFIKTINLKKETEAELRFNNPGKDIFLSCSGIFIPLKKEKNIKGVFILKSFTGNTDLITHSEISRKEEVKRLLDTIDLVMYRVKNVNTDHREIEFISKNTNAMFGMDFKNYMELLKDGTILTYFHPDDVDKIIEANRVLKNRKKPVQERYRFLNPKLNKYIWVEEKSFPVLNAKRQITEIIGVTRNINEQVEKELQIQESEKSYRNIIEKNLAGFYRIGIGGKIIEANDAFARIFGFKYRKQVLKRKPRQIYSRSTDQDTFIDEIKRKRKLVNHESEVVLNSGEVKNILENASYFRNEITGEEFIEGTLFDITDFKRTQKALAENEKKFKELFERNLAGVFITTLNGDLVDCNQAFIGIFGYKNKQELTRKGSQSLYFTKSDRDRYIRDLKKNGILTNYELVLRKKNGTPVFILINVVLEKENAYGQPIIQGTLIDITGMKEITRKLEESVIKYRNLYENASDAILILEDEKIVDCNKQAMELFECDRNVLEKCVLRDITSALQEDPVRSIKKSFLSASRRRNQFNWVFHNKRSQPIYAEVTVTPVSIEGKAQRQCIIRNVTERVIRERELLLQMENYQQLIEHSPDGNLIVDNGIIVYANPSAAQMLGFKKVKELVYLKVKDLIPRRYQQEINKLFNLARKNAGFTRFYEYRMFGPRHQEVEVGMQVVPVKYRGAECLNVIIYDLALKKQLAQEQMRAQVAEETTRKLQNEITQHKNTQEKLAEQVAYTRSVLESSVNMVFLTMNRKGDITSFNQTFEYMAKSYFNYEIKKGTNFIKFITSVMATDDEKPLLKMIDDAFKGKSGQIEGTLRNSRNDKVWFESYFNPIRIAGKKIEEISLLSTEITERKQRNEQLKQSLKEKEVLLKEVHHRVKNNLQIISSILNLQSSFSRDESINEILKESQNRIKSMSFIHESLYQTKNFSHINISDYILNLSKNLVHSYYVGNQIVDLNLDLGEYTLALDQAIPCGLIINEIITNSLKYAFDDVNNAAIHVRIHEPRPNEMELVISDNGKGLPKGFDITKTPTLGLQLVTSLVEQLDGDIKVKSGAGGVKVAIRFKKQTTN